MGTPGSFKIGHESPMKNPGIAKKQGETLKEWYKTPEGIEKRNRTSARNKKLGLCEKPLYNRKEWLKTKNGKKWVDEYTKNRKNWDLDYVNKVSKTLTGRRLSMEHKDNISKNVKESLKSHRHDKAVVEQIDIFRSDGFHCVRTDKKPVPDFIAIKDGKIFAVEVEFDIRHKLNKYKDNDPNIAYADVIWIVKENQKGKK
jgi:hypothetical protein